MRKAVHVAFACFLLSVAHVGLAQNTNSSDIRGTAIDASGAVLPGVTVTVTNNDTGVIRTFVTTSDGLYDTNSILPGNYTITFSKEGFEKLVRGPIPLQVGLVTINGNLKVGSSTQTVEVTSEAPLLKTEDAQVANTLSTEQLAARRAYHQVAPPARRVAAPLSRSLILQPCRLSSASMSPIRAISRSAIKLASP